MENVKNADENATVFLLKPIAHLDLRFTPLLTSSQELWFHAFIVGLALTNIEY